MGKIKEKKAENWSEIEKKTENSSGKCFLFALKNQEKFFTFFPNCTCKKSRLPLGEESQESIGSLNYLSGKRLKSYAPPPPKKDVRQ
jgi:hypothetical protein